MGGAPHENVDHMGPGAPTGTTDEREAFYTLTNEVVTGCLATLQSITLKQTVVMRVMLVATVQVGPAKPVGMLLTGMPNIIWMA